MRKALSKRRISKRILGVVIALSMVLTVLPMGGIPVHAEGETVSVAYSYPVYNTDGEPTSGIKEWKEASQECTPITASTTTLGTAGDTTWYVINSEAKDDLTISGTVTISGNVNIILADESKLTVNGTADKAGINVSGTGNSLTIYGQSEETGQLIVKGGNFAAGIGGNREETGNNITINGGSVTATGGKFGAGIGGGDKKLGSNITINGGSVVASTIEYGTGIGGGDNGAGSDITINGGTVTAIGKECAAGIGGGRRGNGSNITINEGTVTANGGIYGAGIGGGDDGGGNNITINGGNVSATAQRATGIGGGYGKTGSGIAIASYLKVVAGSSENNNAEITTEESDWAPQFSGKLYVHIYELAHTHSFEDGWTSDASGHWH